MPAAIPTPDRFMRCPGLGSGLPVRFCVDFGSSWCTNGVVCGLYSKYMSPWNESTLAAVRLAFAVIILQICLSFDATLDLREIQLARSKMHRRAQRRVQICLPLPVAPPTNQCGPTPDIQTLPVSATTRCARPSYPHHSSNTCWFAPKSLCVAQGTTGWLPALLLKALAILRHAPTSCSSIDQVLYLRGICERIGRYFCVAQLSSPLSSYCGTRRSALFRSSLFLLFTIWLCVWRSRCVRCRRRSVFSFAG